MPYRITTKDPTVEHALRRIAREQIDKALREIDDVEPHEAVHQVRKRCKKVRALARLVRGAFPDYKSANTFFRDTARDVSSLRDATTIIEALDRLLDHFADHIDTASFAPVRETLVRRRAALGADENLSHTLNHLTRRLTEGLALAESWTLDADAFDAVGPGLARTYTRARDHLDALESATPERLHEFRKRVKYHWYHMRLLRSLWPDEIDARRTLADDLADVLGRDHDLVVLRAAIVEAPDDFADHHTTETLLALLDRRRAEHRAAMRPMADRLLAEDPDALTHRLARYWSAWRGGAGAP